MNITILSAGTRGDVQPYIALGLGLRRAGHQVRLASHAIFQELITSAGLEFALIELNPREALADAKGQAWLQSGSNPFKFMRGLLDLMLPRLNQFLEQSWQAAQGSDALIYAPLAMGGPHIAEKLGIPALFAALQPNRPSREYPHSFFPALPLGPLYNLFTHRARQVLGYSLSGPLWQPINTWRTQALGLPPMTVATFQQRHAQRPALYGYSQHVVPRPADWPAFAHVTGYWFWDTPAGWQPPADLAAFLAAGPPPVYIGFGSMPDANAAATTELLLAALHQTGQRAIMLRGWGGLTAQQLPDTVLLIDSVPHDWLFPQLAGVVHHGGAGTTAAGLRAGLPSLVVPFFGDQPFWGRRVAALGVGPAPIARRQLRVARLVEALTQLTSDPAIRRRAAELGTRIRSEDGLGNAVAAIEHEVGSNKHLTVAINRAEKPNYVDTY